MYVCIYASCQCAYIYIYGWGWMMEWLMDGWFTAYAVSSYSSRGDSQSNFLRILMHSLPDAPHSDLSWLLSSRENNN